MRLVEILQVKRTNNVFELNDCRIPAIRKATDGYGVLVVFERSQLDADFSQALGTNHLCWFPSAEQLKQILAALDLSDSLTCNWLRKGKGWDAGPRPFREDMRVSEFVEGA